MLKPPKTQEDRSSTNAKLYPRAWQRKETMKKLLPATPIIRLHQLQVREHMNEIFKNQPWEAKGTTGAPTGAKHKKRKVNIINLCKSKKVRN